MKIIELILLRDKLKNEIERFKEKECDLLLIFEFILFYRFIKII